MALLPQKLQELQFHEFHTLKDQQVEFIKTFFRCHGNITRTCRMQTIDRKTYYNWKKDNEEFKSIVEDAREVAHDFVEDKLFSLIKAGNPSAIIFYCKTQMRHKGYGETLTHLPAPKHEITVTYDNTNFKKEDEE